MTITSITLEHTNPSMGPHETITTVSLSGSSNHMDKINTFLTNSTINNTTTLKAYMEAIHSKNETLRQQVLNNAPDRILMEGATISNLSFHFAESPTVALNDVYRRYDLSHFKPEFTSYMVEHGTITKFNPNETPLNTFDNSSLI